jgi:hypothetical protein
MTMITIARLILYDNNNNSEDKDKNNSDDEGNNKSIQANTKRQF